MTTTIEAGEQLELATALVRLSHLVQHVFADVSRAHDLTPQQTQLLCVLIGGPLRMTELKGLLNLEKSSVTGLVDRVELRDLVARQRDPDDRRAWQVALTAQGAELAADAHQDVIARLETLIGDILPADRDHVATVITKVLAQHGATAGRARPPRGDAARARKATS